MAIFIALTRVGPPARLVLVNVDHILLAQPNQNGGTSFLFGKEHVVSFVEEFSEVERKIADGPYVRADHA